MTTSEIFDIESVNNTMATELSISNVTGRDTQTNQFNVTHRAIDQSLGTFTIITVAAIVLSCICLVFAIIVYSTLARFRNVHGKNLTTISACLLTNYVMLLLDFNLRDHVVFPVCLAIEILLHASLMATFFWTNVMTYDLWRSLTNLRVGLKRTSKRYLKYSVYCWTGTLLTILLTAGLELTDLIPKQSSDAEIQRCWLRNENAFMYYFNIPIGIILFSNLIMFLTMVKNLMVLKKMEGILQVRQQTKRFNLYLKLFLVTGITWIVEFIPLVIGFGVLYELAILLSSLQGVFLFFIFIGKMNILQEIFQRCVWSRTNITEALYKPTSDSCKKKKLCLGNRNETKF